MKKNLLFFLALVILTVSCYSSMDKKETVVDSTKVSVVDSVSTVDTIVLKK